MRMFPLAALVAGFVSVQSWSAAADALVWQTHSFRLLNAATEAPLAGAKVLVFPNKEPGNQWQSHESITLQRDPLGGRLIPRHPLDFGPDPQNPSPAVSDADGNVTLPVPSQEANLVVMNEHGIAFLHEGQWNQNGGDVQASLQAWASLSGTVTLRGKPAAGVLVAFSRSEATTTIRSSFGFYFPPLQHSVVVRTDQDGRFRIERLLPTSLDGSHDVPYDVREIIGANPDLKIDDIPAGRFLFLGIGMEKSAMSLGRGTIPFAAGEHRDFDFAATPRVEREVSGRLVWTDGTPLQPADLKGNSVNFMPDGFNGTSGYFPPLSVDSDGRFKTTVLIAGKWMLNTFRLHPVGAAAFGLPFVLPDAPAENGRGDPVDVGDIVFQKTGRVEGTPAKPNEQGQVEIAFTLVDDHRHPLPEATVKVHALVSATKVSSRYLYPKDIPDVHTDASGVARMKVPVVFRENSKEWTITGVDLEMSHAGYEPWTHVLALNERGAVLALKTAASVSIRVVKEGQSLPLAQVQMRVGWLQGWDSFEHRKWRDDAAGLLARDQVPSGNWQVQAAHLDGEQWRWFSEVTEVAAPGQKAPAVLTLRRGTRVAGTLDASAPRPVKRGMVRIVVRTPPPSDPSAKPILWSDWQAVDESGAFVFRGLPPGDSWIAAACDGWISEASKDKPKHLPGDANWSDAICMLWNAVPLHVDAADTHIVVPMVRAGTVVFHFKHPDGTPVTGIRLDFDPRLDLGPAREMLATTERSLDQFLAKQDENGYRPEAFLPRFPEELDPSGTLRLENLPPAHLRLGLESHHQRLSPTDERQIPSDHPYDRQAPFQADVKPGEVVEKEFVVVESRE